MQIVIEISEGLFEEMKEKPFIKIHDEVINGIILPKGHGPLKDQNELLKHEAFVRIGEDYEDYAVPTECFAEVPAVIEADEGTDDE